MKATKKIVGATAALVAAVALSAGSTFAWFATSDQVTVSSMNVNVAVTNNLLISDAAQGQYAGTISMGTGLTTMSPVSTVGAQSNIEPTFYEVQTPAGITQDGGTFTENTVFAEATANTDYYYKDFYLKYADGTESTLASGKKIVATINVSGQTDGIGKSIRVMVDVISDSTSHTTFIYAPNNTDVSYSGIKQLGSGNKISNAEQETCLSSVSLSTSGTTAIIDDIKLNTPTQVRIYIWYEGQDTNCTTTNAYIATANLSVGVTFDAQSST